VFTLNEPGNTGTALLTDDADHPGSGVLIVTGSAGSDLIVIEPRPSNRAQLRVTRNSQLLGIFSAARVQHIVVFGRAGDDTIVVNATLRIAATLFGDAGNDQFFGGRGADGVDGGAGNDRLFGGGGNDVVCGGDGNDSLYGQAGNDLLGGDAGNDRIWGEAGNDQLQGGAGHDSLYGGNGNDLVFGQTGNDLLHGDNGNDVLVGGAGNDRLIGGLGRDVLIGGDGADELIGEAHDDILIGGSTVHDENTEALRAILAEWSSTRTYGARVSNIRSGGGATGGFTLDDGSVLDDDLADTLRGGDGLDWFLLGIGDRARDRTRNERVN
jgi:Ca2+-binding RTX toxin-like protein